MFSNRIRLSSLQISFNKSEEENIPNVDLSIEDGEHLKNGMTVFLPLLLHISLILYA
ncbi:hypothetical protein [Glaciecola petra]|uniref:Uncharacterized protein n=1 Tax=Glaciecola petra TaxID=3075602 RepID=A0ABU2ZLB9_9ALTE|nr:hypothetical protein [Aestuariibacter sp. P117]MDT0593429.1 hypothetical protein [Aestuariibacter sp. P117]